MLNTYKVEAVATTPGSNMASVQLPRKGTIKQIVFNAMCILETDSVMRLQVALNRATVQSGSQAVPCNVLVELHVQALLTTSGMSNGMAFICVPQNQPIVEKDILYLHGVADSGGTNGATASALIFVEE